LDQGLHHLQGKAERVKPEQLLALLLDVHRDKLALLHRHEAGARVVGQYDFNNTYQNIIAREETHLSWLRAAIEGLGGQLPGTAPESLPVPHEGKGDGATRAVLEDDARLVQAFVERWSSRIEEVTQARHKGMLRVILGEALEHRRFFEQAAAGRSDLLGRHLQPNAHQGRVLDRRWIE
jgi:hypothetical protein